MTYGISRLVLEAASPAYFDFLSQV